jgi:hypothetical protein
VDAVSAEIRANAVEIVRLGTRRHQARCRIEGCGWAGELRGSYQEANGDRQAHLQEHRDGTR